MKYVVTNEQMKKAEAACDKGGLSYREMMKNAGDAVARRISEEHSPCRTAVLCGAGNNGGDGFVIAARLLEKGFDVRVILVCGQPRSECALHFLGELAKDRVWDYTAEAEKCELFVHGAQIAVDCVFGTGFHGMLPPAADRIFIVANACPVRIAVDVPSGVNSDTGEVESGSFRPTATYILAAFKKGLLVPQAMELMGKFELLDIGIDEKHFAEYEAKITDDSARSVLPKRAVVSHKGNYGRLLNIAGCMMYSGAAYMSTQAALRTGAGLVTLAAPKSVCAGLMGSLVENTFLPLCETDEGFVGSISDDAAARLFSRMNAVSIGCGMGDNENTRSLTRNVVKRALCPIIIDADGINTLSSDINILKERRGETVITPHPREFSRISGFSTFEIQQDRIGTAKYFAQEYGVVVLLKGAYTVITDGIEVYVNPTGNGALAKGGSGDVLTGIIAAMTAQGIEPLKAAVSGAYCHGYAADLLVKEKAAASVTARDIIEKLPVVYG